jgi:multidrug efflux pump subunit AcrA (membrane-fusion protein)
MKRTTFIAAFVLSCFALCADGQPYQAQPDDPVVQGVVRVSDHVKLPAREAGVLIHLGVKEGSQVRAGQQVGKIDDREIQQQMKAADYALRSAAKKYEDDVDIRYSEKGAAVAKADYEIMQAAINLVEKSITEVDLRRAKLEWDKMALAAEKAGKEKELLLFEAHTKKAELELAKLALERRSIVAPFDGVVDEVARKQDEWVNPGDPILKLFRMDVMQVDGAVDQKLFDPHELQNCKVTVEVQMARGRKETLEGRISMVSSTIGYDGMFNVRAEVPNRQEHGSWLLRDGLPATIRIHLGTGGAAAAGVSKVEGRESRVEGQK